MIDWGGRHMTVRPCTVGRRLRLSAACLLCLALLVPPTAARTQPGLAAFRIVEPVAGPDGRPLYQKGPEGEEYPVFRPAAPDDPIARAVWSGKRDTPLAINLNTAGPVELMTIPGVTSDVARALIEWRDENGFFRSLEDIKRVDDVPDSIHQAMASMEKAK